MLNNSFSKMSLGIIGLIAMQPLVSASAAQGTDAALRAAVEQISAETVAVEKIAAEQITLEPLRTVVPQHLKFRPVKTRRKPVTRLPIALSAPGVDNVQSRDIWKEPSTGGMQQAEQPSPALATEESPYAISNVLRPVTTESQGLSPMGQPDQAAVPTLVSLQTSPRAVTQDSESSIQASPEAMVEQRGKPAVDQADTVAGHRIPTVVPQPIEIPLDPQPSSIGTVILNQLQQGSSETVAIAQPQYQPPHQRYFIQSGDTLYKLSRRFGIALEALVEVNDIEDPNMIFSGNTLSITPVDSMLTNSTLPTQAASITPNQMSGSPVYAWPADGTLTSGYGWRWGRMHRGVDIAAPVGTPVVAAAAGMVEFVGWNAGGYGNLVEIRHVDGSLTRYAHNHRLLVQQHQDVTQGQVIAQVGSTGRSTGPHLHFEIIQSGRGSVDPLNYLAIALPQK